MMRRRHGPWLLIAGLLSATAACSDEHTGLRVTFDAEPSLLPLLGSVELAIEPLSGGPSDLGLPARTVTLGPGGEAELPIIVGVRPFDGDATREVRIHMAAGMRLPGTCTVPPVTRRERFEPGTIRDVTLRLACGASPDGGMRDGGMLDAAPSTDDGDVRPPVDSGPALMDVSPSLPDATDDGAPPDAATADACPASDLNVGSGILNVCATGFASISGSGSTLTFMDECGVDVTFSLTRLSIEGSWSQCPDPHVITSITGQGDRIVVEDSCGQVRSLSVTGATVSGGGQLSGGLDQVSGSGNQIHIRDETLSTQTLTFAAFQCP